MQRFRYFIFGQNLADGLRITLAIIIPALVFASFGNVELGIAVSLGAMLVSISDGPGPVVHKRNGMLICSGVIFIMALLTGFLNSNTFTLALLVLSSTFFFSMFSVFGQRAGSVGTAALLVMILRMSRLVEGTEVFSQAALTLLGGLWYFGVSMLFYRLTPYRPAQRALGNCIFMTAKYLEIKARLYDPSADLDNEFSNLLNQQVEVSKSQDEVRELLFKNRTILKESTQYGRVLVVTFTYLVDLFENIMAIWYDYSHLRERYKNTGILEEIQEVIKGIADELRNIAEDIHSNNRYEAQVDILVLLEDLKGKIDALPGPESTFTLRKILVNLRNLHEQIIEIQKYFNQDLTGKRKPVELQNYSRFVSHERISPTVFFNSFTMKSSIFRHSLRVMITCGLGFFIAKSISTGHHSYWILMTIIIILKPEYSLTKSKNFDRLIGTIAGGIIGLLFIGFIPNENVLLAVLFVCMIFTYTFVRLNYIVMVIFLTPYVLIMFYFLGLGVVDIAGERLADTAIASSLAWASSKYLFPRWESENMRNYMTAVLKANIQYLQKLFDLFSGKQISILEYKLIRKELLVSTANLSAGLHRMLSEPKSKQLYRKDIYQFVVLNHVLSSNIAAITAEAMENPQVAPKDIVVRIKRVLGALHESMLKFNKKAEPLPLLLTEPAGSDGIPVEPNLKDQIVFIQKVSEDIQKLSLKLSSVRFPGK